LPLVRVATAIPVAQTRYVPAVVTLTDVWYPCEPAIPMAALTSLRAALAVVVTDLVLPSGAVTLNWTGIEADGTPASKDQPATSSRAEDPALMKATESRYPVGGSLTATGTLRQPRVVLPAANGATGMA